MTFRRPAICSPIAVGHFVATTFLPTPFVAGSLLSWAGAFVCLLISFQHKSTTMSDGIIADDAEKPTRAEDGLRQLLRSDLIEIAEAVTLALVAVATAWST